MSDIGKKLFLTVEALDENCVKCGLWKHCKNPYMDSEGSDSPLYIIVGEAPGAVEDDVGFPFQGDAGEVLRQAIEDVGIPLEKCRFTNVVKCRPPSNDLKAWPDAIELCQPHILREIHSLKPKVVILLGNSATESVLNQTGILRLHGRVINGEFCRYVCSFHPAYLLRQNNEPTRKKFLEPFKIAKKIVENEKRQKHERQRERIVIRDKRMLYEYVDELKSRRPKGEIVVTDLEGSTLNPFSKVRKAEVGCVGFALGEWSGVTIPVTVSRGHQGRT